MNIKLIAIDLDGTTLKDDHWTISQRTDRAIRAAIDKGILVVPATGRIDSFLPPFITDIHGIRYLVTSNGAVTYDMQNHQIMFSDFISAELALKIVNLLPTKDVLVEIFQDGKLFVEQSFMETLSEYPVPFLRLDFMKRVHVRVDDLSTFIKSHSDHIEKINLPFVPAQWQRPLKEKLSALPNIALTSSVVNNLEINTATTNKGAALRKLCNFLQIAPENVLAVGDNGNDIEMLKFAGISAAMANATDAAKAAATTVTLANDEDGVALAIEKYALS